MSDRGEENFDINEIDRVGITDRHKLIIADCIMAWAVFDSQFRAMLTAVEDRDLDAGALDYDRLKISQAWQKLQKSLKAQGAVDSVLDIIKKHEKNYWQAVEARNMIAHAGCVGVWTTDRDYLVFAPFEAERLGRMVVIRQPLEEIERSTNWARAFSGLADRIMRGRGY